MKWSSEQGQYTLEWVVVMAAMAVAVILMQDYVRGAFRADGKVTEMQLNGAMQDNRP